MNQSAWQDVAPILNRVVSAGVIGLVRAYQTVLSPLLGDNCRFHPSCSQYCIDAVRKYGAADGGIRALKRVLRCHPFHPGGYDPA